MSTHAELNSDAHRLQQSRQEGKRNLILTLCAAAGVGVLFAHSFSLNQIAGILRIAVEPTVWPDTPLYVVPIVSILALVIWKLKPVRSWPWLLAAGVVCSAAMSPALFTESAFVSYVPTSLQPPLILIAPVLTLIGVVGAGAWLSTQGMPSAGSALVGTAVVIQLVGAISGNLLLFLGTWEMMKWVVGLLIVLGLVGSVVALVTGHGVPNEGGPQPTWHVTIAGGLGALASLAPGFLGAEMTPSPDFPYFGVGVLILGVALVIGLMAGWRALLSSVVVGSINAVIVILLLPTINDLRRLPELAFALLVLGLVLGIAAASISARSRVAITGLVMVGMAFLLLLLWLDPSSENFSDTWEIATPILVLVTLIATVCAIATIGQVLARRGETPAVLLGVATPFQLAGLLLFLGLQLNTEFEGPAINSVLMPTSIGLFIAAAALGALVGRAERSGENTRLEEQSQTAVTEPI